MHKLLSGGLSSTLAELVTSADRLASSSIWDGPRAAQFRGTSWPSLKRGLVQAIDRLNTLEAASEQVLKGIVTAGSTGALASGGPLSMVASVLPVGATGTAHEVGSGTASVGGPTTLTPQQQAVLQQVLSADPSHPVDPRAVSGWWQSLSPNERKALIAQYPAQIGATDGIPAVARSQANVGQVQPALNQLKQQLALVQSGQAPGDAQAIQHKIDLVNAVCARVHCDANPPPDGTGQPLLMGFDTRGEVHAILAYGNPDTAKNVATFVPGMTTQSNVGNFNSTFDGASTIQKAAQKTADTAVIAWIGYDTPSGVDAASPAAAQAGAGPLDNFEKGILATHQAGTSPHVTVIGHSYGSLLVGQATQQPGGLPVNDILVAGSPGMGVVNASELGLPPGHVWAMRNNEDVINWADKASGLGIMPGMSAGPFGESPTDTEFGANDVQTTPGNPLDPIGSHGQYFNQPADVQNIANVVTGDYQSVALKSGLQQAWETVKPAEP